jgi:biopolymer transport protein ExbD
MLIRRKRSVPELNTTSTADISFMLLVFFLVTSSMDSDKGLGRRLPPVDEQQEQQDISRSNVLQIRLDADDRLFCNDTTVTLQELQQQVESFVASRQTDRHIIAVETDRKTSYDAYFEMQNAVVAAYRSLREKMARQWYGHSLKDCSQEEREQIMQRYPQRISEGVK